MTNGVPLGTAKGVVYRVTVTDPNKTLELEDGTVLKGTVCLLNIEGAELGDKGYLFAECCAWVKDIVPIILVPEHLKKNGWKYNDMMPYPTYFKGKTSEYVLTFDKDNWRFKYDGRFLPVEIKYIHQLQHLLFGLGLNSEMEV